MKRVVVTGMGIVSCLGNDKNTVLDALRAGRSGIKFQETYKEMGFRSHVAGSVDINLAELIDRKVLRFMGDAAAYAYISMQQAITDSGLSEEQVSNERTGIIMGSGGASSMNLVEAADILREKLGAMRAVVSRCEPFIPAAHQAFETRLRQRLVDALGSADDERVRQEVVVFASRIDVTEELERLKTHLEEVERVLTTGGNAGKRLDFLMQELNREANTLGSKSVGGEVSTAAMELKLLIEQMREQVQNIE